MAHEGTPVTTRDAGPPGAATRAATGAATAGAGGAAPSQRWPWWPLVAVSLAIFMLLIDVTIVNVALPDVQRDLGASFSDLQWVIDAYALTLAAFLLTAGSLGDRLGRRVLFVAGIVVFALASLGCGLATSPAALYAFRAVQGVGGAIMFATSLALLAASYRGRERGVAFGVYGAVTGASVAIGPLVGGLLVTGLSWRWIFFVNLPIAAVAVVLSLARLTESRDPRARRVDVPGLLTFSTGLAVLVYALIRGSDQGWGSAATLGELAAGAVLLGAFLLVEHRSADPMVDLALFRRPAFVGAQVAAFGVSATLFALFLYITLYLQNVLGYSALQTGLRLLTVSGVSLVVAPVAGRATERVPLRLLISGGLVLVAAGLLLMLGLGPDSTWLHLLAGLLLAGAGTGLVNAPLGALAVGVVEPQRAGMASGINSTFRQVGIATGTAAYGALFTAHVTDRVAGAAASAGAPAAAVARLVQAVVTGAVRGGAAALPPAARAPFTRLATEAFTSGLDVLLTIAGVVAALCALACLLLIRQRDVRHA